MKTAPVVALFLIFLVVGGCSSGRKKERLAFRQMFATGDYKGCLELLKDSKLAKDKNSQLLNLLEEGMVHHAAKNYYQSSRAFEAAKAQIGQLYTVSLGKKAKTVVANENYDDFRGELYEISLVHFYQSLNHYLLSQQGFYEAFFDPQSKKEVAKVDLSPRQIKQHLRAARAEVVAWDSFWKTKRVDGEVKTIFKHDLLGKVYGGLIHEAMNIRGDDQIALQLYKDARKILAKNYSAYKTFNKDFVAFKSKKKKSIRGTSHRTQLMNFLNYKILYLTKHIRSWDLGNVKARFSPSAKVLKKLKASKRKHNVGVVLQLGLIAPKVSNKYNFGFSGLKGSNVKNSAIRRIGLPVLTFFAANVLGLTPSPGNWSAPKAYLGVSMAQAAVENVGIAFEMPKIDNGSAQYLAKLTVKKASGQTVHTDYMPLINPMGDIAEELVAEVGTARYVKLGSRVAMKYMAAIATAYATYASLKKKSEFLARNAAVLSFIGASKVIEKSEKADVRHWSSLPNGIHLQELYLAPGNYTMAVEIFNQSGNTWKKIKGYEPRSVSVVSRTKKVVVNFHKTLQL